MPTITLAPFPIRLPVPKKCCNCGKGETETEFYAGRSNKCKACIKDDYNRKKETFGSQGTDWKSAELKRLARILNANYKYFISKK